jgi:hypothetical protein
MWKPLLMVLACTVFLTVSVRPLSARSGHGGGHCHRPGRSGTHTFSAPHVVALVVPFQSVPRHRFCSIPFHHTPVVVHPWLSTGEYHPARYYYYCDDPPGYYPDMSECPGGWRLVLWPQ